MRITELKVKVLEIFGGLDGDDAEIAWYEGLGELEVSQMYEYVDFNFETLQRLAVLFGTQKINVGDKDSYSGCETCDYGSKYTQTFHFTDHTLKVERDEN